MAPPRRVNDRACYRYAPPRAAGSLLAAHADPDDLSTKLIAPMTRYQEE